MEVSFYYLLIAAKALLLGGALGGPYGPFYYLLIAAFSSRGRRRMGITAPHFLLSLDCCDRAGGPSPHSHADPTPFLLSLDCCAVREAEVGWQHGRHVPFYYLLIAAKRPVSRASQGDELSTIS